MLHDMHSNNNNNKCEKKEKITEFTIHVGQKCICFFMRIDFLLLIFFSLFLFQFHFEQFRIKFAFMSSSRNPSMTSPFFMHFLFLAKRYIRFPHFKMSLIVVENVKNVIIECWTIWCIWSNDSMPVTHSHNFVYNVSSIFYFFRHEQCIILFRNC